MTGPSASALQDHAQLFLQLNSVGPFLVSVISRSRFPAPPTGSTGRRVPVACPLPDASTAPVLSVTGKE